MSKKNLRQDAIMEIIDDEIIDTQEMLTARLIARGFGATQATVSRDIKDMRLVKTPLDGGGSRYSAPGVVNLVATPSNVSERLQRIFASSVLSFTPAQNLLVVKTMPGAAQTACEAVDTMNIPEVVGTLGGENTFVIIARASADVQPIMQRLRQMSAAPVDE